MKRNVATLTVVKSTTDPFSDCRNNSRRNGRTPRYLVLDEDGIEAFSSRRKRDCDAVVQWAAAHWDGKGDLELAYLSR